MSTLRGFVWRIVNPGAPWSIPVPRPWCADVGHGTWNDPDNMSSEYAVGRFDTQAEALAATCEWLAERAATKTTEYEETES